MTRYVIYGKSFDPRHEPILAHYPVGSTIDLDDDQAEELVAVGALVEEPKDRSKNEPDAEEPKSGSGQRAGTGGTGGKDK